MEEKEKDARIKEFALKGMKTGKSLGEGKFGLVKEIYYKDKVYAGKIEKKTSKFDETDLITNFKSPYIVNIPKIYNNNEYHLILMEKGLNDLNYFIKICQKIFC